MKIPIQNVRNEKFAHIMLKLPTQCNQTSQDMQYVGNCSEPIVDQLFPCLTNVMDQCF